MALIKVNVYSAFIATHYSWRMLVTCVCCSTGRVCGAASIFLYLARVRRQRRVAGRLLVALVLVSCFLACSYLEHKIRRIVISLHVAVPVRNL